LNSKISLPQCDKWFAWIGVLDDEITGIAGERPIIEFALCARADIDHLVEITEMVGNRGPHYAQASRAFVMTVMKLGESEYSNTRANSRADQNSPLSNDNYSSPSIFNCRSTLKRLAVCFIVKDP